MATAEGEPRELVANYFPLVQKPPQRTADRLLLASYDEDGDPIQVMETVWPADRYAIYDEYPSGQPVPTQALDPDAERHLCMVTEAALDEPEETSHPR